MVAEISAHKYSKISPYVIPGLKIKYNDIFNQPEKAKNILFSICEYFKVDLEDVVGKSRLDEYITPRFWAIWFIRANTNLSLKQIGRMMGNRDHTSVIHALKHIKGQLSLKHNNIIKDQYEILVQII